MFHNENRDNFNDLLKMYEDGFLKPHISEVYDLVDGAKAIRDLADRKAKGKVVVRVRS